MNKKPGEIFTAGNGVYVICEVCHKLVKLNKRIFGSLHSCQPDPTLIKQPPPLFPQQDGGLKCKKKA